MQARSTADTGWLTALDMTIDRVLRQHPTDYEPHLRAALDELFPKED